MHSICQDRREHGLLWILAFAAITALTVTTCIKEEKSVAANTTTVVAMKQAVSVQ